MCVSACVYLQVVEVEEPSERIKRAKRNVKKVRRMYNLAQSNEASTRRYRLDISRLLFEC